MDDVVELRDSAARGLGVYARRAFVPGTVVVGIRIARHAEANAVHASQVGVDRFVYFEGIANHLNHSCDPSCDLRADDAHEDHYRLVARQMIEAGDELTFDYATCNHVIEHFEEPCACGAIECRRDIVGWRDLEPVVKRALEARALPYLLDLEARHANRDRPG